jgi:hypothetical protein
MKEAGRSNLFGTDLDYPVDNATHCGCTSALRIGELRARAVQRPLQWFHRRGSSAYTIFWTDHCADPIAHPEPGAAGCHPGPPAQTVAAGTDAFGRGVLTPNNANGSTFSTLFDLLANFRYTGVRPIVADQTSPPNQLRVARPIPLDIERSPVPMPFTPNRMADRCVLSAAALSGRRRR